MLEAYCEKSYRNLRVESQLDIFGRQRRKSYLVQIAAAVTRAPW